MNGLVGNQTLLDAKKLLQEYREGKEPPGTTEAQVCIMFRFSVIAMSL